MAHDEAPAGGDDPAMDEALQRHFAGERLSEDRVELILAEGRQVAPRRSWPKWMSGVAAMLVLGFGGLQMQERASFRGALFAEVAMNHKKNLQAEVVATSFAEISQQLDRVEFDLEPMTPIADAALTGARYCSIQGNLAALLKLQIGERRHTLYVTSTTADLENLAPRSDIHDGVEIRLWQEGERFFALAADVDG